MHPCTYGSLEGDNWNLQKTPGALASPSFSVQRCFGASALYYILADPHGYLAADAVRECDSTFLF